MARNRDLERVSSDSGDGLGDDGEMGQVGQRTVNGS